MFQRTYHWVGLFALLTLCAPVIAQVETLESLPEELTTRPPRSIAEVKQLEEHVQRIIEKVSAATVSVSGGSGVVINDEGYILTVAHVNQRAGRRVRVTFPDGTRVWARTLGNNHALDSGMMKIISEGDFPYVEMGDSDSVEQGEWCLAIGFPLSFSRGQAPPTRLGRVLSRSSRTIVTDCTIMGGDSGGPLFDLDGKVIGVSSRVSGSLNSNVHVPVNKYREEWDRLTGSEEERDADRGFLGVTGDPRSEPAEVTRVIEGSGAATAGIQAGDFLLEIDDKPLNSFREIRVRLLGKKAGETVKVKVKRDDAELLLNVKLAGRSE